MIYYAETLKQFRRFRQFRHFGIFGCLPKPSFGSFGSFSMPKLPSFGKQPYLQLDCILCNTLIDVLFFISVTVMIIFSTFMTQSTGFLLWLSEISYWG
jgi:hypothetical protein